MPVNPALLTGFLLLSLIGFLDSAYLTGQHYGGETLSCPVTGGCDLVSKSTYAVVSGVPVALLGAVYYLSVFLLCVAYFDTRRAVFMRVVAHATWLGLAASAYFVVVQAAVLGAYCFYCLISAATSTLLFVLGRLVLRDKTL